MTDTDARLWHPWLRINRVLRVMLQSHLSAEAWSVVRVEFTRALALRSEIRRAGWFISARRVARCAARTLERGDARERDRYSAPERLLILRSNGAARPDLRRDLVFTTLDLD